MAISVRFGGDVAEVSSKIKSSCNLAEIAANIATELCQNYTEITASLHLRLRLSSSSTKQREKSRQKSTMHSPLFKDTGRTKSLHTTRQIAIDNFLVADNKNLSMTKHLVYESSYRLQMVKNKVVDDKVVFLFKRNTALVVDNKRNSFVVDNSFSPVCMSSISEVYFAAT